MIKSGKIYRPSDYLLKIIGAYFVVRGDDDKKFIDAVLKDNKKKFKSYPLLKTADVVKDGVDAVLVECPVWNNKTESFENQYYWYEVPKDFNSSDED